MQDTGALTEAQRRSEHYSEPWTYEAMYAYFYKKATEQRTAIEEENKTFEKYNGE